MPPSKAGRGGPFSINSSASTAKGINSSAGTAKGLAAKRHRKIARDTISGITAPAIRRMARRGGVKRISKMIYEDARTALKERLQEILRLCVLYVDHRKAKTVTVQDVIYSLRTLGRPIYGFDPETYDGKKKSKTTEESSG
ncbi:histone H4 [Paramyrothecium foliicola]|nr:histone H4 [Paramyrothecium foliicola]